MSSECAAWSIALCQPPAITSSGLVDVLHSYIVHARAAHALNLARYHDQKVLIIKSSITTLEQEELSPRDQENGVWGRGRKV
jgi:hypothetical protein